FQRDRYSTESSEEPSAKRRSEWKERRRRHTFLQTLTACRLPLAAYRLPRPLTACRFPLTASPSAPQQRRTVKEQT
ncbi:MAG: hypothetical protein C0404_12975, partial [Verrucomicrobia bacterium]|nr:hypothetical protein [Verrucomicrobiota bacterium]